MASDHQVAGSSPVGRANFERVGTIDGGSIPSRGAKINSDDDFPDE